MRKFLLTGLLLIGASALAQSLGPRSGPVTWSGATDSGTFLFDAGPLIIDGGVCADGGLVCTMCGNSCAVDAGPQVGDAGGYIQIPFTHLQQLPVPYAVYEKGISSDPISAAGFNQGALLQVTVSPLPVGGSAAFGTVCLNQGYPAPQSLWQDAGCLGLDGGPQLLLFGAGPTALPAFEITYAPGPGSDGGNLSGIFSLQRN